MKCINLATIYKTILRILKVRLGEVGKMAPQERGFAALTEDLDLIPTNQR